MANLTEKQLALFGKVSRWQMAAMKAKGEAADLNKKITELTKKRDRAQTRVDWFDARIQEALDKIQEVLQ